SPRPRLACWSCEEASCRHATRCRASCKRGVLQSHASFVPRFEPPHGKMYVFFVYVPPPVLITRRLTMNSVAREKFHPENRATMIFHLLRRSAALLATCAMSLIAASSASAAEDASPWDGDARSAVRLKLDYAVCEKLCVPAEGQAELVLTGGRSAHDAALAAAEARVPKKAAVGEGSPLAVKSVRRELTGSRPRVIVDIAAPSTTQVDLFAEGPSPEWAL